MDKDQLWLVKYSHNRVRGPLSTEDIIDFIQESKIVGEEFIAKYPNGKWQSIALHPVFYDHLMAQLSQKKNTSSPVPSSSTDLVNSSSVSSSDKTASITEIADLKSLKSLKKEKSSTSSIPKKKKFVYKVKPVVSVSHSDSSHSSDTSSPVEEQEYEEESAPVGIYHQFQKWKRKIIIMLSLIIGVVVLINIDSNESTDFVQLKAPKWNKTALSQKAVKHFKRQGILFYLKSDFTGYVQAQEKLLKAVEGDKRNTEAMVFLCLTYLELWPFSKKDFKNARVVVTVLQMLSQKNTSGVRSAVCQSVESFIKGDYGRAKNIVESALNSSLSEKDAFLSSFFYYLKALSLYYMKDYSTMNMYLDSAQKMSPHWLRPQILNAQALLKQNKQSEALVVYNHILRKNPHNKLALLQAGLIEYRKFRKIDKAQKLFTKALKKPERVLDDILSHTYLALAEIALGKNQTDQALIYARKSYSYNPLNKTSTQLIVKLGGKQKLKQIKIRGSQLVEQGDQLLLNKDIRKAISYYEEAFKISRGQNSIAALKAGKGFFMLGLFSSSFSWLKKSIDADPYAMEPYIVMSKYYLKRYDFKSAEKILILAGRKSPGNYEILTAWGYLNLKRKAYDMAIKYAKRSLKLYEAHVDSLVVLSKAYMYLGKINESFVFATKAKEVEPNNILVQINYARAYGALYGVDSAVHYFYELIAKTPDIIKYQMELVKYLFEDERYPEAVDKLQTVIDQDPRTPEAYFYLGRIFMKQKSYLSADNAFLQAAIYFPTNSQIAFYIGKLRLKEKKFPEAEKYFSKTLVLNPLYPKANYYLGKTAFLQKKYQQAIEFAKQEIKINPLVPDSFVLIAGSYEKLGFFKKCAKAYQQAILQNAEDLSLYVNTARCYKKSGLLDLAVAILNRAKGSQTSASRSGDPALYKELGSIYELQGVSLEAAEAYCNYLNLVPNAVDKKAIQTKVKKMEQKTGKKFTNCG